jgi:hypothetical protein
MSLANQTGIIGVTNDGASATALFPLGTTVIMNNTDYVYGQAASAIAAAGTTNLTGAFATTAGATYTHDVAAPGVPINQYAFFKKVASPF